MFLTILSALITLSGDTFLWPTLQGEEKIHNFYYFKAYLKHHTYVIFRTRHAVIIEPLRPERFFIRTFNSTSLYILSVCEVWTLKFLKACLFTFSLILLGLWLLSVPLLSILQPGQHTASPLDTSPRLPHYCVDF